MWKDIAAAALAVAPLWGGAIALWSLAFKQPLAAVRAVAVVCDRSSVVLALANDGDASAVLKLPLLKIMRSAANLSTSGIELRPDAPTYPYLLSAKQSLSVTLKPRIGGTMVDLPSDPGPGPNVCRLQIEVPFRGFGDQEQAVSTSCACPAAAS